jgi:hypothetical protein
VVNDFLFLYGISIMKITDLNITHPDWDALAPHWRTIRDLKMGAINIEANIKKYLPPRPDEDEELYRLRVAKFSYTPIMTDAVNKYTSKLSGSPVHLSSNDPFWSDFRANNAAPKTPKRKEADLLNQMFKCILYYGTVWVVIDRPDLGIKPRSKYEERGLKNSPYLVVLEPLDVIYWGDDWAISRVIYPLVEPFKPSRKVCRWTYYGSNENVIYEVECNTKPAMDSAGNKYECLREVKIGEDWVTPEDPKALLEPGSLSAVGVPILTHNLGIPTITTISASPEKWVCQQVANKQIQHLRIENAWTDAGYLSGVVQRLFTPEPPPPVDDFRTQYQQPDYNQQLGKAGNTHILIGRGYAFVESTGAALANLEGQLDKIESQIRQLVSLHYASANTSVLNQSGASKAMDMSQLEESMVNYGELMISLYNNILSVVARMLKKAEVTATGLNSYSVDILGDLITDLVEIEKLPSVPPTAKKIAYGKLSKLLTGTASPEDEEKINDELEQLFDNAEIDLEQVAELYGLTVEEAKAVLDA